MGASTSRSTTEATITAGGGLAVELTFLYRASQQGHNARNSRPPIIPKIRMGFRGAKTVPSQGWLFGRRERCRNRVELRDFLEMVCVDETFAMF